MDQYKNIVVETRGQVQWIRISRPGSRNALSRATLSELRLACAESAAAAQLKAVVVTGEGKEAFAAGGDLKELSTVRSLEDAGALWDLASAALDGIRNHPLPVVAALNGLALGGGAELALACDFRVASGSARIGYVQARLNICSGFGGGADLMRILGDRAGLLHALRASALTPGEALAAGLVDEIAGDNETLDGCVERFLAPILTLEPQVIRAYKAMSVAARQGLSIEERRAVERRMFCETWTHDDHWAAVERWMQQQQMKANRA